MRRWLARAEEPDAESLSRLARALKVSEVTARVLILRGVADVDAGKEYRITSYNVCYTKLLRSLGDLRKISEEGVEFQSHLDGSRHTLTPESSIAVQEALGADIIMAFDECIPYPATHDYAAKSIKKTLRWAEACKQAHGRTDQA